MWTLEDILRPVCLLDAAFASLYIFLIEMILLAALVPVLGDLSSHGKTRQDVSPAPSQSWLHYLSNGQVFLVEKRYFRHFYVTGLISLFCCIWLGYSKTAMDQGSLPATSTLLVLAIHLMRRMYECCHVHQWRKGSKMHISGYLLGVGHYVWLPMMFIKLPCQNARCSLLAQWANGDSSMGPLASLLSFLHHVPIWIFSLSPKCEEQSQQQQQQQQQEEATGAFYSGNNYLRVSFFLLCLWAQYQQYRHHVLLASLRKGNNACNGTNNNNNKEDTESESAYSAPMGGWFTYISCPHYLAEFLIYACFTALMELEPVAHRPPEHRHWLMLAFVLVIMTVSATQSHEWYQSNIANYSKLERKALIPFVY